MSSSLSCVRTALGGWSRGAPWAAEIRLTVVGESHALSPLVAELRRGDERQILLDSWPRTPPPSQPGANSDVRTGAAQVTLEKKLIWEQDQPILDAIRLDDSVLVLDASRLLLIRGEERLESVLIPRLHPLPRDMRGRLLPKDSEFTAWLPGAVCRVAAQPRLTAECRESQEPWPLAPGATAVFSCDPQLFRRTRDP